MSPAAISSVLLLILASSAADAAAAAAAANLTAYEYLELYNFPIGLLPQGVTGYDINSSTGNFKVYLPQTCSFNIDGYQLKYQPTIAGTISTDRITSLKGVSVKVLFLWLNIGEISRQRNEIEFSVGIASADFPLDGFDESPQCGCGFDCVTGGRGGARFSFDRFVSALFVE